VLCTAKSALNWTKSRGWSISSSNHHSGHESSMPITYAGAASLVATMTVSTGPITQLHPFNFILMQNRSHEGVLRTGECSQPTSSPRFIQQSNNWEAEDGRNNCRKPVQCIILAELHIIVMADCRCHHLYLPVVCVCRVLWEIKWFIA